MFADTHRKHLMVADATPSATGGINNMSEWHLLLVYSAMSNDVKILIWKYEKDMRSHWLSSLESFPIWV